MPGKAFATVVAAVAAVLVTAPAPAQEAAAVLAQAERDRRHFHTGSALRGFEQAAADPRVAADAWLGIGRIRAFRGWQAEGAFPGWHEEVDQRPLALAAYRRAAELRPSWAEPHVALSLVMLSMSAFDFSPYFAGSTPAGGVAFFTPVASASSSPVAAHV